MMDAAVMSDLWFVFSIGCLVAGLLGSVRWLLLTRAPREARPGRAGRAGACGEEEFSLAAGRGCPDGAGFACDVDRRIIWYRGPDGTQPPPGSLPALHFVSRSRVKIISQENIFVP
jgi:hypothetical protein